MKLVVVAPPVMTLRGRRRTVASSSSGQNGEGKGAGALDEVVMMGSAIVL